jgi:hypothetical protein
LSSVFCATTSTAGKRPNKVNIKVRDLKFMFRFSSMNRI